MGGGGAAAKPKKSVEIIVVGRGEGYSDSWIPIFDAWVFVLLLSLLYPTQNSSRIFNFHSVSPKIYICTHYCEVEE